MTASLPPAIFLMGPTASGNHSHRGLVTFSLRDYQRGFGADLQRMDIGMAKPDAKNIGTSTRIV